MVVGSVECDHDPQCFERPPLVLIRRLDDGSRKRSAHHCVHGLEPFLLHRPTSAALVQRIVFSLKSLLLGRERLQF
jgi:hypothetical protein